MTLRNRERKRRTNPQHALHPDPAPVQLDELPTEGQPQPRTLHLLLRRPHLPELLEDLLLIFQSDANPGISDRDLHEAIPWHCAHIDPPTLRRELDRIGQKVQNNLADLPFVRLNLAQP